ncbi:hypothetical protein ILUMI_08876 [Ignelater luminosus]|uniref:Uncharacterized protein n=1 Tax=Ignelater luminosus TaxID=2038154 RepID=A0A8K0GD01_IGNLU|nr:hypothetical protein ILUMI_08876 [Ignelater luminosus]
MKMCQTDPVKCPVCEIRKACKFINQGVQCDIKTVDTGTQITEEDMIRLGIKVAPVKDALKNQSLAHLTAAQILAAQEESPRKDIFSSTRAVTPPPPPNISPDRQNLRHNLSHSDSFSNRSFSNVDNKKLPSIFDKIFPVPFENRSVNSRPMDSRSVDSRPMDSGRSMDNRPIESRHIDSGRPIDSRPVDSRSMDNRFMDNRSMDNRGMMDRSLPFENMNTMRSNFDNRYEGRFESPEFNSRRIDYDVEFEPPPNNNYNNNPNNQRGFPSSNNRGNNFGSYGGHRY